MLSNSIYINYISYNINIYLVLLCFFLYQIIVISDAGVILYYFFIIYCYQFKIRLQYLSALFYMWVIVDGKFISW